MAQMGEKRGACRVLVNKPEERESLESLSVDGGKNINMDIEGIEWDSVNWIDLAQDRGKCRAVVKHGDEPMVSIKYSEFLDQLSGVFTLPISFLGILGGAVGSGTALQAGSLRVQFPIVSLEFFINIIPPAALWPWD